MGPVSKIRNLQIENHDRSAESGSGRQAGADPREAPLNTAFSGSASEYRTNKCTGSPVFGIRGENRNVPARELLGKITRCSSKTLALSSAFAIFDVDETIIANTGKFIHDEVGGRFESALRLTLRRALKSVLLDSDPIRDSQRKKELIREMRGRWKEDFCSAFAGYQELKVCQEMCRLAEEKLSSRGVIVMLDAKYMKKKSHELVKRLFDMHQEDLYLVPGVRELAQALKDSGAKLAPCTSSPENIIRYLLHRVFPGWGSIFSKGHFDAVKKNGNSDYSASAVEETCRENMLNCHPSETVMFGDSTADLGTALMAGVPLVVIRPATYNEKSVEKLERAFATLREQHPEKVAGCAVVIVKDFSQVEVGLWHNLHAEFTSSQVESSARRVAVNSDDAA